MGERGTNPILDEIDLMLIRELETNARKTYLELGARLGLNHVTVSRRLQRLMEEGMVSFVTMADHITLGYFTQATLRINARPGKVDAVAAQLASFRDVQLLIGTAGRYDLMATIMIRDLDDLLDFVQGEVERIPDVTNVHTVLVIKRFKYGWSHTGGKNCTVRDKAASFSLDALDRSLIGELELQPRETISQLAKTLRVSRTTVSRKLQALFDEEVIWIRCVPDLWSLGYRIWTILQLKVASSCLNDVVEKLSGYSNITHIVMTTGEFQLTTSAIFRDREDMHCFLSNDLSIIPGVTQTEFILITKHYKRSFQLASQGGSKAR
ncbi:MAG: Lrp/AsnC family transcriptional regulator [Dehalococcoidia bacterium]|nr:Lrp/AsnC family transcriptional regulator [Dehalococcoidia bacterium]